MSQKDGSGNTLIMWPILLDHFMQVLWQADCGNSNDRAYIAIDSTGAISLISRYWGTTGGTDYSQISTVALGTVAAGAVFKVAVAISPSQIRGALNGTGGHADSIGAIGAAHLRIGASTTSGEEWQGTISAISIFNGAETLQWLIGRTKTDAVIPAYQRSPSTVLTIGDSWAEYSSTGMSPMLLDAGYDVFSVGVGGSNMVNQRDYALAQPDLLKNSVFIWWDGVPNDHVDGQIENEKSYLEAVIAAAGHTRFIWCRNGQAQSSTTQYTDMTNFFNWVKQTYGADRVYDPTALYTRLAIQDPNNAGYASDQARLAQNFVPFSLMLTDQAHLLQSIRREVIKEIQPIIQTLSTL